MFAGKSTQLISTGAKHGQTNGKKCSNSHLSAAKCRASTPKQQNPHFYTKRHVYHPVFNPKNTNVPVSTPQVLISAPAVPVSAFSCVLKKETCSPLGGGCSVPRPPVLTVTFHLDQLSLTQISCCVAISGGYWHRWWINTETSSSFCFIYIQYVWGYLEELCRHYLFFHILLNYVERKME